MLKGTHSKAAPAFAATIASPSPSRPLRIWPATLMLTVFWAFLIAHYTFEMDMFPRFLSRMIAYGLLLIGFLTWWLTRRQISRRDRWLAVAIVVLTSIVAGLLADSSVNLFVLFMSAFPFIFTAWAAWIIVARNRSLGIQRAGFIVVIAAVTGFFALLRWDGLYGNQIPQFSWRWTKTAEELFDSEHSAAAQSDKLPTHEWTLQAGDWPEFRGPNRDSVVNGTKLDTDWTANPPKLLWKKRVGPAWSSMIVVDGFLVTQEQRGEQEAVVCYEAATGNEVWSHTDSERFFEGLSGVGPRSTPTFANGRIYTLGANGRLSCLAPTTGKSIWSRDVIRDTGGEIPQWGYSVSPLVVDGKVIAFAGGKDAKSAAIPPIARRSSCRSQASGKS
jgi:outer membrane protein assembly factor BamB